ncbi:hypothetical protein [Amycolatopsis thailandensis]|nr:hypothetical protein [Amycolatopsis thailandensis]
MKLTTLAKSKCIQDLALVMDMGVPSASGTCIYHGAFDSESGACPRCNR